MKRSKALKEWLIIAITVTPIVYYLFLWSSLPATIPIHFDAHGNPDNYGSRSYMAITLFFLTIGTYILIRYIPKIDPKKNFAIFHDTFLKLRMVLALFFSTIGFIIINSIKNGQSNTALLFIIIAFVISIMGNYMGNIRPNYFIGIRTPWTLDSDVVWKKTHHRTGRLWFVSGIVIGILMLVLPAEYIAATFITAIIVITLYPLIYSFYHYKKQKS